MLDYCNREILLLMCIYIKHLEVSAGQSEDPFDELINKLLHMFCMQSVYLQTNQKLQLKRFTSEICRERTKY